MFCRVAIVVIVCWTGSGITGLPWPVTDADVREVNEGRYATYALVVPDDVLPAYHTQQSLHAEIPAILVTSDGSTGVHRLKRSTTEKSPVPPPVIEIQEEDSVEAADDSDMYLNDEDAIGASQHFFPSFYPSYASPRQQHAYSSTSQRPILQRSNNNFQPIGFLHQAQADSSGQDNLLGSGNFGVIRGGTYYNDADNEQGQSSGYDNHQAYTPYYHNNGHGRPSFYKGGSTNPRPQHHGKDFFANFRDFADINAPTKASYSELYVVYVNKNASRHDEKPNVLVHGDKPRNIIEQLALIDLHDKTEPKVPEKKSSLSAGKLKLARTFKTKQDKAKKASSPKELYEPLLALS